MQKFTQKKIALAVGTALMVMAGASEASVPALRAANPMLAASVNGGTDNALIRSLLSATGAVNKAITIDVALTQAPVALAAVATTNTSTTVTATSTAGLVPGMVLSGNANIPAGATVASITNATTFVISAAATGTATLVATATPPAGPIVGGVASANNGAVTSAAALVMGNGTPANNSVIVWAGATNAAVVPSTGATAVIGDTTAGVAHMTISLPAPGATAAYRVNGATGALEFTADNTVAAPTWNAVKVDIQQVAGKEIYTEANATGGRTAGTDQDLVASAGTAAGNSLAPTPIVSTTSAAGGTLVNGFKIDTGASITLTNANLAVKTRATATAFPAAALPTAPACVAATVTVNGSCTVTFVGLGTLASAADFAAPVGVDAADVTFYNSTNFNTGVINGTVPWTVDGVNATKASYTNVFNTSDGVASKLANVGGAAAGDAAAFPATTVVSDGAAPVIVANGITFSTPSTGTPSLTNVGVTFSETMVLIGGNDLREVLENINVGTNTLAALSLNSGASPSLAAIATTNGQSTLTVNDVATADVATLAGGVYTGKSMSVSRGITFQEANDTSYTANLAGTAVAMGNATTTNANATLTVTSTAGVIPGSVISGVANVPVGTTVISVTNATTLQMSALATATAGPAGGAVATAASTLDALSGIGAYGEQLAGGVASATAVVEAVPATPVAQVAVAPAPTVTWGTDTSALASASSALNPDQIDTITVTFDAGKGVKFAPIGTTFGTAAALTVAKTNADLAANLVIDVHGATGSGTAVPMGSATTANTSTTLTVSSTAGVIPGSVISGVANIPAGTTVVAILSGTTLQMSAAATLTAGPTAGAVATAAGATFQVKPLSATLDTANQITVRLPTALIYSKLAALGTHLKAVYIGYVADGNNQQNNTLVSTDASSTLTSPVRVAAGTLQPAGAGTAAELTAAGAEPVVLPLVFTATQTGGQSTLLTQNIQSNVVGAGAGSIVSAYLARWEDAPTPTINVVGADLTSGKITNPGDKVATDLAIEFADSAGAQDSGAALAFSIQTELRKVAKAAAAVPGVSNAAAAVAAKPIPVYVKLVRSSDTQANTKGAQNYLESRAIMSTTYAGARAALVNNATAANGSANDNNPVYEVLLNPATGAITGRLTGNITIKPSTSDGTRGLVFMTSTGADGAATVIGSALTAQASATGLALPGTANLNLLMGIDPASDDIAAFKAKNPFVLLVHRDSTGRYTMLTSADPTAANYMPFAPDLFNTAVGAGGIATRVPTLLSVTDTKAFDLPKSANWALFGLANPATKTAVPAVAPEKAFPRRFVGLNTATGVPESFWTSDGGATADMAMAMAGNKVGVATELLTDLPATTTGPTLSNISDANMVAGAKAIAWTNERGAIDGATAKLGKLYVAQATGPFAPAAAAAAPKLAPGWSLVNVPGTVGASVTTLGTVVDAVIKVGAQVGLTGTTLTAEGTGAGVGTGQFTWFAVDGAMPALTGGEAVFVHAKAAGNL